MRRGLLLLTAITFVTWVGTRITAVVLPLIALAETRQVWTTGLVGGMAGLPLLTVGWWGRGLRDRLVSGRAMAGVMGVNAVGLTIVPITLAFGQVDAVALCTSGLVTGIAAALLGPAERSLVSDLADEHVAAGGRAGAARWLAWQDGAQRISMIFAPPAGAWLLTMCGARPLLWCESIIAAAAALILLGVPAAFAAARETAVPDDGEQRLQNGLRRVSAMAVLRAHPQVAAGILMAGVGGLCWFGFSLGLAVLGVEQGKPGELIAAGMSGYGVASVAGSLCAPLTVDRLPKMVTMTSSWMLLGSAFLLLPLVSPNLVAIALVAAAGGLAMPLGIAALNGLINSHTSGADRRAAFTVETVFHSGGTSLGLLAGGALIGATGAGTMLVATGLVQIIAALVCARWAWDTRLGVRIHRVGSLRLWQRPRQTLNPRFPLRPPG